MPPFYNPRELELFDIDKDCRLPCTDFIGVLAHIPPLEILKLGGFLKEDAGDDVERYVARKDKTQLHHIKYLDVSCPAVGEMAQFLCTLILLANYGYSLQSTQSPTHHHLAIKTFSTPFEDKDSFQTSFRSTHIKDCSDNLVVMGFHEPELPYVDRSGHSTTVGLDFLVLRKRIERRLLAIVSPATPSD